MSSPLEGQARSCGVIWRFPRPFEKRPVCKTSTPGSNPGGASNFFLGSHRRCAGRVQKPRRVRRPDSPSSEPGRAPRGIGVPAGLLPKYLRVSSTRVSALEALMRHPGGWIGAGPCVNHRAAAGAGRGPEHGGRRPHIIRCRPHIIRCRRVSWVAARRPAE